MKVEQCRICHSKSLQLILDLGVTALANSFVKPGEVSADEPKFPLRLVLCSDCGLVQIDEEVAPEILFIEQSIRWLRPPTVKLRACVKCVIFCR